MTCRGKTHARRFIHDCALLLCDACADGPAWNVADVATALGVTSRATEHLRKRFVEDGLEAVLERKPRETRQLVEYGGDRSHRFDRPVT